jgi:serine/threonine protein kinase
VEWLSLPYVRYGILAVLAVVVLVAARRFQKWMAGAEERELQRQLSEAIASGDHKLAGDIQVRRGNLVEASRIFQRANEHGRAGTVLAMLGRDKEAAEEYEKGSEWAKAAPLFKKVGDLARAAQCFEKSGEREDLIAAADCYVASDEPLKAARLYQDAEDFEKAAGAFMKVDDLDALEVALTMLENAAIAEKENPKRKKRLWARAGEVGLKLGAHDRAAKAFDEAGDFAKAADVYENALKQFDVAAVLYEEAGDKMAATRATRAAGGEAAVETTRLARARAKGNTDLAEKLTGRSRDRDDEPKPKKTSAASDEGSTKATIVHAKEAIDPTLPAAVDVRGGREVKRRAPDFDARFELAGELGRGGMGIVYRAKDQKLGRFVALKFLPEDVDPGSTMARLFRREARAAAALSHPGIVTVYDVGELDGREFIAMELVEGTTLDRVLEKNGALPIPEALDVMEKVLEAVEYAHGKSVVHRDLKPANLMRTKGGIKIMDFGLAKVMTSKSSGNTIIGGTPNYMPPEQSTGHADHRSDVFSLGVTFYELLTGELPGRPGEPASTASFYPSPRERVPEVPPRLSELVMHCLEKNREERPQDVVSVLYEVREIRDLVRSGGDKARRPAASPAPSPGPSSPHSRREDPTPEKRPLPARIAREEDDEPRAARVEHLGPSPKPLASPRPVASSPRPMATSPKPRPKR